MILPTTPRRAVAAKHSHQAADWRSLGHSLLMSHPPRQLFVQCGASGPGVDMGQVSTLRHHDQRAARAPSQVRTSIAAAVAAAVAGAVAAVFRLPCDTGCWARPGWMAGWLDHLIRSALIEKQRGKLLLLPCFCRASYPMGGTCLTSM